MEKKVQLVIGQCFHLAAPYDNKADLGIREMVDFLIPKHYEEGIYSNTTLVV